MSKKNIKKTEKVGLVITYTFALGMLAVGSSLGFYNLLGIESTFPLLESLSNTLGLWWFAIALLGVVLYLLNRSISKIVKD